MIAIESETIWAHGSWVGPGVVILFLILIFAAGDDIFAALPPQHPGEGEPGKVVNSDLYVAIDGYESAYNVFILIPKASLDKIQSSMGKEKVDIESWEHFQTAANRYVQRSIIKNEYPEYSISAIQKGLLEFLKQYPGMPIGVTWNGGIAMTYGDYEHAKTIMKKYLEDKDEYERTRNRDPKADPLNPRNHFEALIGVSFLD